MPKPNGRSLLASLLLLILILNCAAPTFAADYEVLATLLSKPLYPTYELARAGYSDERVISRVAEVGYAIKNADAWPAELSGIAAAAHGDLEACRLALGRINELASKSPDYEGIIEKAVVASPAMFREDPDTGELLAADKRAVADLAVKGIEELVIAGANSYDLSKAWGDYQRHYAKLDGAALRLIPVAKARPCQFGIGTDLVALRLSGSCDGAFDTDDLSIRNVSGRDLTNCTLLVRLATDAAEPGKEYVKEHVHFVSKWPRNETLVAMYHNSNSQRIACNESFPFVQRVRVQLFSDEFQGTADYSYWGSQDRKADLKGYLDNHVTFSGRFLVGYDGLFVQGDGLYKADSAVRLWLNQVEGSPVPQLSPSKVTVTLRQGRRSAAETWSSPTLRGGGVLEFRTFTSEKFNPLSDPDSYELLFNFHGTDHEHLVKFDLR